MSHPTILRQTILSRILPIIGVLAADKVALVDWVAPRATRWSNSKVRRGPIT
jgi:hypothetical protein